MTEITKIKEVKHIDFDIFHEEIVPANQPVVIKNLISNNPAVVQGRQSPRAISDYLKSFYNGRLVPTFNGPTDIDGRFFYREDMKGFNFTPVNKRFDQVFDELIELIEVEDPTSLYVGSILLDEHFPNFTAQNPLSLLTGKMCEPRIWVGNEVTVSAHYDNPNNIACVVAGKRRFTLFPIDQVKNLYVGPLDFTPAGQCLSLVNFDKPDFDRFPKFREALRHAQVADLEAGDALFLPGMWWHHVKSLEKFNILLTYWWEDTPRYLGAQIDPLFHAILSIRELPLHRRNAWRELFDYFIFQEQHPLSHLPEDARGVLSKMSPQVAARLRQRLINNLNK